MSEHTTEPVVQHQTQPNQNHNNAFLIILLIVVFLVGSGGFILMQKKNSNSSGSAQNPYAMQEQKILNAPIAPYDLVYGSWDSNNSVIKSLDLNSGVDKTIAVLPSNIKKVTPLAPDKVLYIDKTDVNDHGTQITAYNFTNGSSQTSVKAAGGYGIDDYVVSPNKQYIATWEVAMSGGSSQLKDGRSRVYTASLSNPSQKNLIYDEPANSPVHYPLAVTDDGRVLMDKFQANDINGGTGWAYGMSVSNFNGSQKSDLAQMQNGTYGTQPKISADGQNLVFAGYDGTKGPGTKINRGYRQAVLSPDTVETLSTSTLQRKKLAGLPNSNSYTYAAWNPVGNSVIINQISKAPNASGMYVYNLSTQTASKLNAAADNGDQPSLIASFANGKELLGNIDTSSSSIGNLGDHYSNSFTQFSVRDTSKDSVTPLAIPEAFMQYISMVPNNTLSNTVAGSGGNGANVTSSAQKANQQEGVPSQLKTFFLKASLADIRACNQTGSQSATPQPSGAVSGTPSGIPSGAVSTVPSTAVPSSTVPSAAISQTISTAPASVNSVKKVKGARTSRNLIAQVSSTVPSSSLPSGAVSAVPSAAISGTPSGSGSAQCQQRCRDIVGPQCEDQGLQQGTDAYSQCLQNGIKTNREAGVCYDSPLYVYGNAGQQIQVKVNTPVFPTGVPYNDGYNITLTNDKKLSVNGSLLDSISYDYTPALRKVDMPTRGYVVALNDLTNTIEKYAKGLGLNTQETADVVAYAKAQIHAPYVYVSNYDQKTSQSILPLSFSTRPDNYLNVIFYFKPLAYNPGVSVQAPDFSNPVKRNGLTVVEVSEYLDY